MTYDDIKSKLEAYSTSVDRGYLRIDGNNPKEFYDFFCFQFNLSPKDATVKIHYNKACNEILSQLKSTQHKTKSENISSTVDILLEAMDIQLTDVNSVFGYYRVRNGTAPYNLTRYSDIYIEAKSVNIEMELFLEFNKQDFIDELNRKDSMYREKMIHSLREKIKYDPKADSTLLKQFCDVCFKEQKYNETILRHWLWNLKRKIFMMNPWCPIFLNLSGGAGTGKSRVVKDYLLDWLDPCYFDHISDIVELMENERKLYRFTENFVGICNELKGAHKMDIESFKDKIDSPTLTVPMMYVHKSQTCRNTISLIGTSNSKFSEVFGVISDMRKMFEFEFNDFKISEVETKLNKPLNNVDFLEMIQSIDETSDCEWSNDRKLYEAVCQYSESLFEKKDSLLSMFIVKISDAGYHLSTTKNLYGDYIEYLKGSTEKPIGSQKFYKHLRKLGWEIDTQHSRLKRPSVLEHEDEDEDEVTAKLNKIKNKTKQYDF